MIDKHGEKAENYFCDLIAQQKQNKSTSPNL